MTIKAGDFVVWHNRDAVKLTVKSAPGNPYKFRVTVGSGDDSPPLCFPRSDKEAGVDGFRYQVRTPGRSTTSPEAIKARDQQDKAMADAEREWLEARATYRVRERLLKEARDAHPAGSREVEEAERNVKGAQVQLNQAENDKRVQDEKQKERRTIASAEPYGDVSGVVYVEPRKTRTPLTTEVCRRLREINKDLTDIRPGWFEHGGKKDVPWKEACYVGRCGDSYTWVCPQGLRPACRVHHHRPQSRDHREGGPSDRRARGPEVFSGYSHSQSLT